MRTSSSALMLATPSAELLSPRGVPPFAVAGGATLTTSSWGFPPFRLWESFTANQADASRAELERDTIPISKRTSTTQALLSLDDRSILLSQLLFWVLYCSERYGQAGVHFAWRASSFQKVCNVANRNQTAGQGLDSCTVPATSSNQSLVSYTTHRPKSMSSSLPYSINNCGHRRDLGVGWLAGHYKDVLFNSPGGWW